MLKDTSMTGSLILHQMANEKGVTRENIYAVVLGYLRYKVYLCLSIPTSFPWHDRRIVTKLGMHVWIDLGMVGTYKIANPHPRGSKGGREVGGREGPFPLSAISNI